MEYISVYTTLPDIKKAKELAKKMLKERLCGCANIFKVDSLYWWKGKIEEDVEYGLILKTKKKIYSKLEKRIKELHPYDIPMIISYKIESGNKSYFKWIDGEVRV